MREIAVLGARGDGKSVMAAIAQVLYAERHRAQGGALPVRILVATDTFMSHRAKLCRTLEEALWHGLWVPREDKHLWVATLAGVEYVHLELIGVEDQGALDRMRQAAHALWLEEAAPGGDRGVVLGAVRGRARDRDHLVAVAELRAPGAAYQ